MQIGPPPFADAKVVKNNEPTKGQPIIYLKLYVTPLLSSTKVKEITIFKR